MHFPLRLSLAASLFAAVAFAEIPAHPFSPVTYEHEQRPAPVEGVPATQPGPMSLFVTTIDLTSPDVKLRVSRGGPDPDGDGEWQTILMPTSKIADREGFDLAINASFFGAQSTKDIEGKNTGFVAGKWAKVVGISMTDGKPWSEPKPEWPVLLIRGDHRVELADGKKPIPADATQALSGNGWVLRDSKVVSPKSSTGKPGMFEVRHPRTCVGLDAKHTKLVILTVDGRRPKTSIGMTGDELAVEMKRLGCTDAINLDGGGSTTLVLRDPDTGKLEVINNVSDGKERSVASALGISFKGAKHAPTTAP